MATPLIFILLVCNSFGFAAKLFGEIKKIDAVSGDKVIMPCDVTSNSNDSLLLVVWYKGNKPIYSYDSRQLKHWRSDKFFQSERLLFTFHTEPASLLIDKINLYDTGLYRCRADFANSPTRNIGIELFVIIQPGKPFFMDEIGMKVENKVGPLHEGDTLLLICLVVGGIPVPKVTWWNQNTLLDSTDEPSEIPNVRENQLMLTLTRDYAGTKIYCQASNTNLSVPMSSSLNIELYVSPEIVNIMSSNQALSVGKVYELPCYVNGSYPQPQVSWWLNGRPITDQKIVTDTMNGVIISVLHFKPRTEHNKMDLTCRATNNVMAPSLSTKMHTLKLNIFYPPILTMSVITNDSDDGFIAENDRIQLRCMVDANPWITNTEWFANNKTIQGGSFNGSLITLTPSDLIIHSASARHSGTYSCMAFNLEGSGISNTLHLQISYRPKCTIYDSISYDNATEIRCPIVAHPHPTEYYWMIRNHSRTESNETIRLDVEVLNMSHIEGVIKNKYLNEYGLLCWANNKVGVQYEPCKITLKRISNVPDPPTDCSVESTENTIDVKCSTGTVETAGSLDRLYGVSVWQIINDTRIIVNNITSPLSTIKVDNVGKGQYEIAVYAFNKWGESSKVILTATTDMSHVKANFDIGMWAGVIVGVISTMVILTMLCIVKKRAKIINASQMEKEAAVNKRNGKQTQNVSVNADLTEKPLLYRNEFSSLNCVDKTEPKICEDINLVQTDVSEPPPISREKKPKFTDCSVSSCDYKRREGSYDDDEPPGDISNIKLFNMSRESIV